MTTVSNKRICIKVEIESAECCFKTSLSIMDVAVHNDVGVKLTFKPYLISEK